MTHPEMVARLMKPKDDLQFTPDHAALIHATLGIAGEAGEIVDAVKKHVIYGKELDIYNMIEELGDMEFYLEDLRQRIGITREQCLEANMAKLAKRYPGFAYTDAKAQERADKADGNGWIEWKGGECPVGRETRVHLRFCDGDELSDCIAGGWIWQHSTGEEPCNITAYRLAK